MKIAPFGIKREKRANAVGVSLNGRLVVVFVLVAGASHRSHFSSTDNS